MVALKFTNLIQAIVKAETALTRLTKAGVFLARQTICLQTVLNGPATGGRCLCSTVRRHAARAPIPLPTLIAPQSHL